MVRQMLAESRRQVPRRSRETIASPCRKPFPPTTGPRSGSRTTSTPSGRTCCGRRRRFPWSPRSSPTRSGRRTTSRSSRCSTRASTTCAWPPGIAVRPAGRSGRRRSCFLPGYQMDPPIPKEWARKGYIALSVAPRGKLRSMRQFNPGYPNLLTYNIVDRHTYAYRGFYVDTWRGIDFLLSRPEVEPTRLGVTGSSQGGGLTITTAAMRPRGPRGVRRGALPLRLHGCHRADAYLSLRGDQRLSAPASGAPPRGARRPSPTSMGSTSPTGSPARSS